MFAYQSAKTTFARGMAIAAAGLFLLLLVQPWSKRLDRDMRYTWNGKLLSVNSPELNLVGGQKRLWRIEPIDEERVRVVIATGQGSQLPLVSYEAVPRLSLVEGTVTQFGVQGKQLVLVLGPESEWRALARPADQPTTTVSEETKRLQSVQRWSRNLIGFLELLGLVLAGLGAVLSVIFLHIPGDEY